MKVAQSKMLMPPPRPPSALDVSEYLHRHPDADTTTQSCQFLTGSSYDQTWPPRSVSAISKPSPFFTKGFALQIGMADSVIMEVAQSKMLMPPPLPPSALDVSEHLHRHPDADTTTQSCQFLTGSFYDQTWPPPSVSAISRPSPFFTKGFALQIGMADTVIMKLPSPRFSRIAV